MAEHERFFIVWTPGCEKSPTVRHQTFTEAKNAASAMANMNGLRYYVLKTISASGPREEIQSVAEVAAE